MITMTMKKTLSEMKIWRIVMLIFMLSFIAVAPPLAQAAVPRYINYQGRLTDSDDNPVTGDINMTVKIYNTESGGTPLWTETQATTVTRGVFNILLGNSEVLDKLDFNSPYWYSVEIDKDGEMTPRQRLTSVAYAINADKIDGYDASQFLRSDADTALTGNLTVTGGVITSGANEDIIIDPTGTGNVIVKIDSTSGDFKVTDNTTDWVLVDSATGNVTIAKDLTVNGTIYGHISAVSGDSTFSSIIVTGASDLRGNISNSGASNGGAVTIADSLSQTGAANQVSFAGNVDAGNGLDVTGDLTVSGKATLSNALNMNSKVDLNYSGDSAALSVNQTGTGPSAQFTGQRVVVGSSEVTNNNAISPGELYVQGDMEVDGTIYGNIASTGDTMLGSLTVTGASDLRGDISDSAGVLTVADNLLVSGAAITSGGTDDYTMGISQTLNDTGAPGGTDVYRGMKINLTETNKTGWNNVYLMDLQVGGVSKFRVDDSGNVIAGGMTSDPLALVTKEYADAIAPATAGGWTDGGTKVYLRDASDKVGIGTDEPGAYNLNVNGSLNTTTLSINTTANITFNTATNNLDVAGVTGGINIPAGTNYKINGLQIASSNLSDSANIPKLNEASTITGDWVNTAHPWADDEVADNITASNYLPLAGGTMTGDIVLSGAGTNIVTSGIDMDLSPAAGYGLTSSVTRSGATGDEVAYNLAATIDKATSGNYTGIKLNVTEASAPGAGNNLLDLQVGTVPKFTVDNGGLISTASVNSASVVNNSLTADDLNVNVVSSVGGVTNDGGDINLVAGANVTITPNDVAKTITIASSYVDTVLSQEQVEDYAGALIAAGTKTNLSVTYQDNGAAAGAIDMAVTGVPVLAPTSEQIIQPTEDVVPLILKGKASGNANVLSIYDGGVTPAEKIYVDNAGHMHVADDTSTPGTAKDSAAAIYFGRNSVDNWETMGYDPTLGTKGKFTFSAPLQVEASSPTGITFVEKDSGGNIIKSQGLTYDPSADEFSFTGGTLKQAFQNLIKNPSFETSTPMGWMGLMNNYGYAISSTVYKFGLKSLIVNDNDPNTNKGIKSMTSALDPDWKRLLGKTITLSFWAKADSTVTTSIGFDSTGTETDSDTNNEIVPEQVNDINLTTNWQNFKFS